MGQRDCKVRIDHHVESTRSARPTPRVARSHCAPTTTAETDCRRNARDEESTLEIAQARSGPPSRTRRLFVLTSRCNTTPTRIQICCGQWISTAAPGENHRGRGCAFGGVSPPGSSASSSLRAPCATWWSPSVCWTDTLGRRFRNERNRSRHGRAVSRHEACRRPSRSRRARIPRPGSGSFHAEPAPSPIRDCSLSIPDR